MRNLLNGQSGVLGRSVLFIHLFLSPLVFYCGVLEAFEDVKAAILGMTAIGLLAYAWHSLCWSGVPSDARAFLREPTSWALIGLAASAALSTALSISPITSVWGEPERHAGLLTFLAYALLWIATRILCRGPEDARFLVLAPVFAAVVVVGYAFLQFFGADPFSWAEGVQFGAYRRPFSTLGNPNHLAAFLLMVWPLLLFHLREAPPGRRVWKAALGGAAALLPLVIALTLSRGAWLGMAGSVLVLAVGWGAPRVQKRWIVPALLVLCVGLGATAIIGLNSGGFGNALSRRLSLFGDLSGRGDVWTVAWQVFQDHPLVGAGLDAFPLMFAHYAPSAHEEIATKAHNGVLQVLATQGVCGGVAACGMLAALVFTTQRAWRFSNGAQRSLIVALAASLIGWAIQGMFNFTVVGFGTLLVTCSSLLVVLAGGRRTAAESEAPRRLAPWQMLLAGTGWLGAGAAIAWLVVFPLKEQMIVFAGERDLLSDPSQAAADYAEAIGWAPVGDVTWNKCGVAAQQQALRTSDPVERQRWLRQAEDAYRRATALVPAQPVYRFNRGQALALLAKEGLADPTEAYAEMDRAVEQAPVNSSFAVSASQAALELNDLPRARAYAERGCALNPASGPELGQLGMVALAQRRLPEAARLLQDAHKADWRWQDHAFHLQVVQTAAVVLLGCGRYEQAAEWAEAAAAMSSPSPLPNWVKVVTLEARGRRPEALACCRELVAAFPAWELGRKALQRLEHAPNGGPETSSGPPSPGAAHSGAAPGADVRSGN